MSRTRFAAPQHTEVGTSALLLAPADSSRLNTRIQNTGANTLFLGQSAVTALTGLALDAGQVCTIVTSMALYGVTAASAPAHAVVTETLQ